MDFPVIRVWLYGNKGAELLLVLNYCNHQCCLYACYLLDVAVHREWKAGLWRLGLTVAQVAIPVDFWLVRAY